MGSLERCWYVGWWGWYVDLWWNASAAVHAHVVGLRQMWWREMHVRPQGLPLWHTLQHAEAEHTRRKKIASFMREVRKIMNLSKRDYRNFKEYC